VSERPKTVKNSTSLALQGTTLGATAQCHTFLETSFHAQRLPWRQCRPILNRLKVIKL